MLTYAACAEKHVFCFLCHDDALEKSYTCPTCGDPAKPKTQRVC